MATYRIPEFRLPVLTDKIDAGILAVVSLWFVMDRFGLYFRKPPPLCRRQWAW